MEKERLGLLEKVLQRQREERGPADPGTLATMSSLVGAYRQAGRTEEAFQLEEEKLKLQREHLGAEHSATLASMNCLAVAYLDAGRTAEAIELHEETFGCGARNSARTIPTPSCR